MKFFLGMKCEAKFGEMSEMAGVFEWNKWNFLERSGIFWNGMGLNYRDGAPARRWDKMTQKGVEKKIVSRYIAVDSGFREVVRRYAEVRSQHFRGVIFTR